MYILFAQVLVDLQTSDVLMDVPGSIEDDTPITNSREFNTPHFTEKL